MRAVGGGRARLYLPADPLVGACDTDLDMRQFRVHCFEVFRLRYKVGLGHDQIADLHLVQGLDGLQGYSVLPLQRLEAVGHPSEPDDLPGPEFRPDGMPYLIDIRHRRVGGVPKTPKVQEGTGIAIAAVMLTSAPVGVQTGRIVASVALIPGNPLEKGLEFAHASPPPSMTPRK